MLRLLAAVSLASAVGCSPDASHVASSQSAVTRTNYALNHAATQSSTYASVYDASRAVDGDTTGSLMVVPTTHTRLDANAWWQVDLGASVPIDNIELWGRTDCCVDRRTDLYVFVSNTPFASNDPAQTLLQPGVFSTFIAGEAQIPTQMADVGVSGRYVRIQLKGTNYLSLAEVRVWGTTGATAPDGGTAGGTGGGCQLPANATSTVCTGPWQFQTLKDPCTVHHDDSASDNGCSSYLDTAHPNYPTCRHKSFGCDAGATNNNQASSQENVRTHTERRCSKMKPDGGCQMWTTDSYLDETCQTHANNVAGSLLNGANQGSCWTPIVTAFDGPSFTGLYHPNITSRSCSFTINNVPIWKESKGPVCPGQITYPTRYSACDTSSVGQCGPNSGQLYSAMGADSSSLQSLYPMPANNETPTSLPQLVYNPASVPSCTTCEDVAVGSDATSVQKKATCLMTTAFAGLDQTTASTVVTANHRTAKLLLEQYGNYLQGDGPKDTLRKSIEALYVSDVTSGGTPACGLSWTPVTPSPACSAAFGSAPAFSQQDWQQTNLDMAVCIRMPDSHVTDAVRLFYETRCLVDLPARLVKMPAACDKTPFETQYASLSVKWLKDKLGKGAFNFADPTKRDANVREVQHELDLVQTWYEDQAQLQPNPDALFTDTNAILAAFWNGVNPGFGSLNASTEVQAKALSDAAKAALEAYEDVILALFSNLPGKTTTAITSLPVLYLLGDALEPIWERLSDAVLYHDLGCRFADCKATHRNDEMTDMWAFIAAIHDKDKLGELIKSFDNNSSFITKDWQTVWTAVHDHHEILENATLVALGTPSSTYRPQLITDTAVDKLPKALTKLQRLVLDAQTKTSNFKGTGSLSGEPANVLQTGIEKSQQTQVQTDFDNAEKALDTSTTSFASNRTALVRSLLEQVGNSGQQTALRDKLKQQIEEYNDADGQILALQHNTDVDDRHFGNFMAAWDVRSKSPTLVNQFQVQPYDQFTVTPGNARARVGSFDGAAAWSVIVDTTTPNHVPTDDVGALVMPVTKGQMIHVNTTGAWAPTCAFSKATWPKEMKTPPVPDPASLIGPEGYVWANSTSNSTTQAHNSSDEQQHSNLNGDQSVKVCLNTSVGYDSGIAKIAGLSWSVSIDTSLCQSWSWSDRHSETTSTNTSGQNSQSANFISGIRLDVNPFPDFPTGALLLVQVAKSTGKPSHVQVIRTPDTGLMIDEDSTVYLVVNDVNECGNAASNQGALQVTVSKLTPASQLAKIVGPLMAAELQGLREGVRDQNGNLLRNGMEQYVAAGAFLPGDRQSLTSASLDDLRNALTGIVDPNGGQQYTLQTLPTELMDLYTTRIDYELDRIERAVQIQTLRLKQKSIQLVFKEISDELNTAKDQAHLIGLEARWALLALDRDDIKLRKNTTALATYLGDYIYPIVRIRYHGLLDPAKNSGFFINGDLVPELKALVNVDWRDELYDQALKVLDAAKEVERIFMLAEAGYTPVGLRPAILSIPRPEALATCLKSPIMCQLSNYTEMDITRAMDFWSDLDKTGQANFEILPENLYRLHGGNAVLDCSWVSPVVRRMQVFLNINDDPASYGSYHTAPMRALGDLLFETDYGPERFIMGNPDWLTGAGSVLFGQGASVEQKVTDLLNNPSINAGFGEGLSPFMTFHIDLSGYRTQDPNPALVHPIISDMSEMVVVFDLEYRTAAAGVRDVGTCH